MGHTVGLGFKAQMDLGTLVLYKGHKCQITNFILNSKREFLKFRIFIPSSSKKKLQLMLIFKVYHFYLFEK